MSLVREKDDIDLHAFCLDYTAFHFAFGFLNLKGKFVMCCDLQKIVLSRDRSQSDSP